jgi:hypothetical protein
MILIAILDDLLAIVCFITLIVSKISPKIFFVSFNSGCRNAFYRWQLDLTFGDFCPPTLTLPLGEGRVGVMFLQIFMQCLGYLTLIRMFWV